MPKPLVLSSKDLELTSADMETPTTPTNAAGEIKAKHAKNVAAEAAGYNPAWDDVWTQGYNKGGAGMGLANVVGKLAQGAGDAIVGAPETLKGMYEGVKQMGSELVDDPSKIVDVPGNIGKGILKQSEALIGPRSTGKALTEVAAPVAVGKVIGAGIRAAGPAAAAGARRITNSIVKPSLKDQAFTKDPTGAILKHRIMGNSTEGYTQNVIGKIDELNGVVEKNVAKSGGQVSPAEINGILENSINRVANQVGNTNKTGTISKLREIQADVTNRYGDRNLSLPEVLNLRREIDGGIVKFTEDAVEQGVNKGKYEFRTGLNDIIERHVPGVKATNMDISSLLSASEALAKRLNSAQNAPILPGPLGIGVEAAAAGGALATGHGLPYAAARLGLKAAGTTAVKSRAAQALESMSGMREPITPIRTPQRQLPYRAGPDTSGITPMSSQGVGAQFEAVSQGMGQGRPGQLQLSAIGETPGSTYNALAGTGRHGGGDLEQRLLQAAPDIQVPGSFSQLSEIQPLVDKITTQARTNALAAQGYKPNQQFEQLPTGEWRFRDKSLLDRQTLEAGQAESAQGGIQRSERRWAGEPQLININPPELPSELEQMPLSSYMNQTQSLSPQSLEWHQNFERTARTLGLTDQQIQTLKRSIGQ